MSKHDTPHTRSDELAVFWIPADVNVPCELKVIPHSFSAMRGMVGGHLTQYPPAFTLLPELKCGCLPSIYVNGDGWLKHSPLNARASTLVVLTDRPILDDAIIIAQGPIRDGSWDLWGLPEGMKNWDGPGTDWPDC